MRHEHPRDRRRLLFRGSLLAALLVVRTTCSLAGQATLLPADWDAQLKLPVAVDLNPDPRIVEINLKALVAPLQIQDGERVDAWTYNGGVPGPLIRARVGDRLIVHFSNKLPAPTTVHWHGLRIPFQMDGVPGHSQPDVEPGQTFTYDFVLRDPGLYWYHPHVMSAAQVGFGLYGALIVDDPGEGVGVADELVLVLSDIGIDDKGTSFEPPDSGGPAGMVFGREGNRVLVNGHRHPQIVARDGAPQRWRVVNAAKSRYFELDLDGQLFTTIGTDGGLQEYATTSDKVVLAPGERADLIVSPKATPGKEVVLRSNLFDRGYGSTEFRDVEDLLTIRFADLPTFSGPPPSLPRGSVAPISSAGATNVRLDMTLGRLRDGGFEYGINNVAFAAGHPVVARLGETQIWTVTNTTKWSHPLHLHGFFFQVLDAQGQPVHPLAWKDTVSVPFGETLRLIVRFDERPGSWMYHCHILDHADGGLMGMVEVGETSGESHASHPQH